MIYKDQIGKSVELPHYPQKIVSLVPSQTELLFHLGLEKEIIGITKFCIHPADKVKNITKIGGTKNLNIQKILSLHPDIIIANKEENEEKQVMDLMNYFPVWVSDIHSINDAMAMIKLMGEICNRVSEAQSMEQAINNRFHAYKGNAVKAISIAYLIWYKPYMTIGGDTFINNMMETGGFKNIFNEKSRYPEVSLEEIFLRNPDYIFLSSEPYPFKQKHIDEIKFLYPQQKVMIVDGEMFSWYGSRMRKAFDYFEELREVLE
jgi:ABC-type Fe3+-hydroxamate transport system substrate-binding protein